MIRRILASFLAFTLAAGPLAPIAFADRPFLARDTVTENVIELAGVHVINDAGTLETISIALTVTALVTVDDLDITGERFTLNSDAAQSVADWTYDVSRPLSLMTDSIDLVLPPLSGLAGQPLISDGGVGSAPDVVTTTFGEADISDGTNLTVDTTFFLLNDDNIEHSVNYETVIDQNVGVILEQLDGNVTSDGVTITFDLQKDGGGDLTLFFQEGFSTLDTTPAATVTLTAGSDASPQINYIFVPQTTKVLTAATSQSVFLQSFSTELAAVATVVVQSAATVQTSGALKVHAWNDRPFRNRGHIPHINAWIRFQHSTYVSGVAQTYTIVSNSGVPDDVFLDLSSGVALQLHDHSTKAFDMSGGNDNAYVVNDSVSAFTQVSDIADITLDSLGGSLLGRYYTLVFWISVSEKDADSKLFVTLPSGSYNQESLAIADSSMFTNFQIPPDFTGASILVSAWTLRQQAASGGTHTSIQQTDLRGQSPSVSAGGGSSLAETEFADNAFLIFHFNDVTKEMAFDASVITTGTTRTYTVPDLDGTMALDENTLSSTIADSALGEIDFQAGIETDIIQSLVGTTVITLSTNDATFADDVTLIGELTSSGTGVNTFAGPIDFIEVATPGTPGANIFRQSAGVDNGKTVLSIISQEGLTFDVLHDTIFVARGAEAGGISAGQAVFFSGSTGNKVQVQLARSDAIATMPAVGIALESIANNAFGYVASIASVSGFDTSSFSEGDVIWVSPTTAGAITATLPTHPNLVQPVGIITRSNVTLGSARINVASSINNGDSGTIQDEFKIGSGTAGAKLLTFSNGFDGSLSWNPTAARTITIPDLTGNMALTSDILDWLRADIADTAVGEIDFTGGIEFDTWQALDNTGVATVSGSVPTFASNIVVTGEVRVPFIRPPGSLTIRTGGGGTIFVDYGAFMTWRDVDGGFVTRMSLNSATGDLSVPTGLLSVGGGTPGIATGAGDIYATDDAEIDGFLTAASMAIGSDVDPGSNIFAVGVLDTTAGTVLARGDAVLAGGFIRMDIAGDSDATHDYWGIVPFGELLFFGPDTNPDAFTFLTGGNLNLTAGILDIDGTGVNDLEGSLEVALTSTFTGETEHLGGIEFETWQNLSGATVATVSVQAVTWPGEADFLVGWEGDTWQSLAGLGVATVSGQEVTFAANILAAGGTFTGGAVAIGVEDTSPGKLTVMGSNIALGGSIEFRNAGDSDAPVESWAIVALGQRLELGPNTDSNAFIFLDSGIITLAGTLNADGTGVNDLEGSLAVALGITPEDLTASLLVSSDGAKKLVSVADLTSWIAGTANEITVTDDADGTVTIDIPDSPEIGGLFGGWRATFFFGNEGQNLDGYMKGSDQVRTATDRILGYVMLRAGSITGLSIRVSDAGGSHVTDGTVTLQVLINDSVVQTVTTPTISAGDEEQASLTQARNTSGDTFSAGDTIELFVDFNTFDGVLNSAAVLEVVFDD